MNNRASKFVLMALMALSCIRPAVAAPPLPGDGMAIGARQCFAALVKPGQPITRLLLELHKEQVNDGDEPVLWAGVYAEKQGETKPGFNRDGCSPFEPGETVRLDHLICDFACDSGRLLLRQTAQGVEISPQELYLRSCGLEEEEHLRGFAVGPGDMGENVLMSPVDDNECRGLMAPQEKIIDDAESSIE